MEIRLLITNKVTTPFLAASQSQLLYVALLLVSLCLWPSTWVQGQTSTADLLPPRFIPKSPTASVFQRFDTQQFVNLPTGGAQLSIPLADVTCGSLRLPVSLAYSYTGLRVSQPSDVVGLGWSLQAGCSITRQVNGVVDNTLGASNNYHPDSVRLSGSRPKYEERAFRNEVDTGPDIYSFSLFSGLSGRFVVNDTTIVLFPQQAVHIRRLGLRGSKGFQITTEDGLRYQFQTIETTQPSPNNFGAIISHASAYQLTRLISPDNTDTLRLHYTSYSYSTPLQCAVTTGRYYAGTFGQIGNVLLDPPDQQCTQAGSYTFQNSKLYASHIQGQVLDSITTRGTHLLLLRDKVKHYELQKVTLVATTGGRREIKSVMLYQGRYAGGVEGDYRLRLDSLRESANGLALPAYRFTYQQDQLLPQRASAAQDHWGFANGAIRNGDYQNTALPWLLADPKLVNHADREPNFTFATLGALQQVVYPTSGATRWEYEAGRIGVNLEDLPHDSLTVEASARYSSAENEHHSISPTDSRQISDSEKKVFHLDQEGYISLYLSRTPYNTDTKYGPSNTYKDFDIWYRLPGRDSLITSIPSGSAYKSLDPDEGKRFIFHLLPGMYSVQVHCEKLEAASEVRLVIPYTDSTNLRAGMLGPGIRVLRTTTLAPGTPALVHTYKYSFGTGYSSGISLLPQYGKGFEAYQYVDVYSAGAEGTITGVNCDFISTSSENRGLGNEFNKYDFYYGQVQEFTGPDQGRMVHAFTHLPQQFNDVVPTSRLVFRQSSSSPQVQQLVQQEKYTYLLDSVQAYPLLKVRLAVSHAHEDLAYAPNQYLSTEYDLQTSFFAPVLLEQVRYDEQGNALTTLTRSTYERQRLRQTATRTSTGWDIQRYKRLSDYALLPAVKVLQINSFNPVLETQTWHRALGSADSLLTSGRITLYDPTWRSPTRLYQLRLDRPQTGLNQETKTNGRYTSLLSDSRYEPEGSVRYARSSGDLIEQLPTHGLPTCYLTGYDRTLVIAQAQNAPYNQVAFTSFEADATGRWLYDSVGTHRQLGGRTGRWAYQLDGTFAVSRRHLPAGDYECTFWRQGTSGLELTLSSGASQAGGQPQQVASAPGDWHQYRTRLHFPTSEGQVQLDAAVGTSCLLDEVRLAPVGAQLTSYTHDPLVGMTSQTDPTGRTVTYEYDGLGRLLRTRDEQGRILSQQQYHYAGK